MICDSTAVGVRVKDGVVLGFEKLITSKMLVEGTCKRLLTVDEHVGIAVSGLLADGRQLVNRARDEAASYREFYGEAIPGKVLAERLAGFVHAYTMYWSVRPFGSSVLVAAKDADGTSLWVIEPSGLTYNYLGAAVGKGKQAAKVCSWVNFKISVECLCITKNGWD
jgi:20S proteasome subunit alpha 7